MPFLKIKEPSRCIRRKIWRYNYGASGNPQERLLLNDQLFDIAKEKYYWCRVIGNRHSRNISKLPRRHSELAFLNPTFPRCVVVCLMKTATDTPRYIALFQINSASDWVPMVNIPLQRNNVYRQSLFLLAFSRRRACSTLREPKT